MRVGQKFTKFSNPNIHFHLVDEIILTEEQQKEVGRVFTCKIMMDETFLSYSTFSEGTIDALCDVGNPLLERLEKVLNDNS
jgi:hypothetical protein